MTEASTSAQKFQAKLSKLTVPAAAIVGGLAVVGKKFVDLAAQAEQNLGGAEAVFGKYADGIKAKGEDAYKTLGLSQSDYLATANKMGSLFQGSGLSQQKSLTMTSDAMQRAADVASVMGLDVTSAMESVTGAAKGNFTMMDNLGVAMNATSIEAYAVSKGMTGFSFATASTAEKTTLAMDMFMEKTSQYAGTFSKELGTMSGAQDMLKAQFENFGTKIGTALLPVLTEMTQHLSGIVDFASENATVLLILAGVLGGLAAGVLVVNGAMKAWAAAQAVGLVATKAWTAAQWLFNAAMTANPIGLVIIAVALLIAAVVLAYQNIGWFRDGVDAALKWIGEAWTNTTKWISDAWTNVTTFLGIAIAAAIAIVRGHFDSMAAGISLAFAVGQIVAQNFIGFFVDGFNNIVNTVRSAIDWVNRLFSGFSVPGWLSKVMSFMGVGATGFSITGGFDMSGLDAGLGATGSILSIGSAGRGGSAPAVTQVTNNITVNGALDANGVARQIGQILDNRDRQRGALPAAGGFR
ncbi:hypothetical protein [Arthrobacter sp. BF1]|uniref:hypothetical protein n=1 Tax=Arthrobacter sp. BF1 TaxID=2821145 RepID=UPI001C4E7525|nr:hypothetical protein [Arthrobacter sp. BF1]